jgi:tetratricopeptide (TPR) repeat protein
MSKGNDASPTEGTPDESAAPLKPKIALALAALVVLGAGLAILQVEASANESNTARETTRVAVRAMRANVVAATAAGLQPVLQAERGFLAFRPPLTANEPTLASAAGVPANQGATAGSLRVAQLQVPGLGLGELVPRLQTQAERLTLKQRALATTRITWNDRSTQYTTVIAVLAVAIFLVGFALVVEGPIRRSAYLLGVGVGLFAAAWAVWVYHLPIPSTPDRGVEATARGTVLTENGSYRAAIASYGAALSADPGYAPAYAGRARARLLAANPDYPVTRAVVATGGAATAAAVADAQRALAGDSRDMLTRALLGLLDFYRGDYEGAETQVDAAISINPKVPDLWLLKSAAELGRGDDAAATASLTHGLTLLRGSAPSQRTRLLASTYLSYLAHVEHDVPARAEAARRLGDRTVAIETAFTLGRTLPKHPPAHGHVAIQRLRFADGRLRLTLRWTNVPAGTALSALGYERPRPGSAWTQPPALALFADLAGSGRRDIAVPLQRVCKPTRVRVDVYLNGRPALSRTGPGVRPTC